MAFLKAILPVLLLAVPRVRLPAPWITTVPLAVTVLPDSLSVESVMLPPELNLANVPVVPDPEIPPPAPAQLPLLKQISTLAVPGSGKL